MDVSPLRTGDPEEHEFSVRQNAALTPHPPLVLCRGVFLLECQLRPPNVCSYDGVDYLFLLDHLRSSPMATSKQDASKAGKLLANPKTPKPVKSVAASDLAQRKPTSAKKSR